MPESTTLDDESDINVNNFATFSITTDTSMRVFCICTELLINIHEHQRDVAGVHCLREKGWYSESWEAYLM